MLAQRIVGHRHVNLTSTRPALFRLRNRGGPLLVTLLWLLLISASACAQGEPRKAGERAKVEPVAPATTVVQPELDEQPGLDSGGGFLTELHVCVGLDKPEKCKRGAVLFTQKCNVCHFFPEVRERSGPRWSGWLDVNDDLSTDNRSSRTGATFAVQSSITTVTTSTCLVMTAPFDKTPMLSRPEASHTDGAS